MIDLLSATGAWCSLLKAEQEKPYFSKLSAAVEDAYAGERRVYPPQENLFRALQLTPPTAVKCVIVGQDPYHEIGQANGLSFSVSKGIALPPSLKNIYKELQEDMGTIPPTHGDLTAWAEQGVLLLNTVLTVYDGQAKSHAKFGWQNFTDAIIRGVNQQTQPVAFILWGNDAKKKAEKGGILTCPYPRFIAESAHPSPLSSYRGFFGSKPFSRVNNFLTDNGQAPIKWDII